MKFLHTADWQIGMKAAHVGEAGQIVRDKRIEAAEKVVSIAKEEHVDFTLIAGDTFEDNGVNRILVQKVGDILAQLKLPVFIIPGNHDPVVPGSVWEHPVWRSTPNVYLLLKEEPVEIPGGILYPCPVYEKHSVKNPTAWIPVREDQQISIGLAHGTIEGIQHQEQEYPIPWNAAARSAVDYLALGHWHSTATYTDEDGAIRMAYSGTHETTKFGERDSGNILIVDIDAAGASPVINRRETGILQWEEILVDITQPDALKRLHEEIEGIRDPSSTLIRLYISGIIQREYIYELKRLEEIITSRFLYSQIDSSKVRPSPEDTSWVENLPQGIVYEAGSRLQQWISPEFADDRPEGVTPEVASRALMELYAIFSEESS